MLDGMTAPLDVRCQADTLSPANSLAREIAGRTMKILLNAVRQASSQQGNSQPPGLQAVWGGRCAQIICYARTSGEHPQGLETAPRRRVVVRGSGTGRRDGSQAISRSLPTSERQASCSGSRRERRA
jgi:hypothetical protein